MAKARNVPLNGSIDLVAGQHVDFSFTAGAAALAFTLLGKVNSITPRMRVVVTALAYDSGSGFLVREGSQSKHLTKAGQQFCIRNSRSISPDYQIRVAHAGGPGGSVNLTIIECTDTAE